MALGLSNISERYKIANAGSILVEEDHEWFMVTLPLVASVKFSEKAAVND